MIKFKIYTTDEHTLNMVSSEFNITLEFLGVNAGRGYVSDGKYLRVFCSDSHVDLCETVLDVTEHYIKKLPFVL